MGKTRILTICGLALYCLVIVLPPIIHNYIYPNVGDDTAAHLAVFDKLKAGTYGNAPLILSYRVVGYPIVWFSNWMGLSMDTLFLWFNYLSLVGIGLAIYLVGSRLAGVKAGWLALAVTIFGAQGILFQFYYGQIFNAINMGIILPLLLFFSVRYISQGKLGQLTVALLFGGLFGAFHTSGIYLPIVAGVATCGYLTYKLARRQYVSLRCVYLGGGLLLLSIFGFLVSITNTKDLLYATLHLLNQVKGIPAGDYLMGIVSPTVLVIAVFVAVNFSGIISGMSDEAKTAVFILACFALVLAVATFAKLSLDPFRQALDLATVLALLVAILVSGFKWTAKNQVAVLVLLLAVGFGLWHNLPTWLGNTNAITQADKEAIAYVNSLNYSEYSCSSKVAYWIYDRFMDSMKWSENGYAPVFIDRNIPMTPRSDAQNKWYEGHGIEPDGDCTLLQSFRAGKVIVRVYEVVP